MADVKISALPPVASAALTDIFPIVQGGVTYQESLTQVKSIFGLNTGANTINLAGNITFAGGFTFQGNLSGNTNVTFPTSGVLATTASLPTLPLSLANGGTGASLTADNGGIFYSNATTGAILASTITARQMLQSGASGAPAWSTATYPATTTANQLLYSSSANTIAGLASANSSALVTDGSGTPSLSQTLPNAVQDNITRLGTVVSGTWNATTIGVLYGGTGQTSYTNGQLLIGNTTGNTLAKATLTGTTDQVVVTNGAGSITLSLPQSINTTSTPQFARLGLGAAADATAGLLVQSTAAFGSIFQGSQTAQSSNIQATLQINSAFVPAVSVNAYSVSVISNSSFNAGGNTIAKAISFYASPVLSGNSGTITDSYGFYYDGGTSGAGTLTNVYGLRIVAPQAGSNKYTAWFDAGVGIGASNSASATNALLVTGAMGCTAALNACSASGIATIGSATPLTVSAAGLLTVANVTDTSSGSTGSINTLGGIGVTKQIYCGTGLTVAAGGASVTSTGSTIISVLGTQTQSANQFGINLTNTMRPGNGANQKAIQIATTFDTTTAGFNTGLGLQVTPTITGVGGNSMTAFYGILISAISGSTAPVTNTYGLYVTAPGYGTTQCTAQFDAGVGIGAINPISTAAAALLVSTSNGVGLQLSGTQTALIGSTDQYALRVISTFAPTAGATNVQVIRAVPTISAAGGTISIASNYYGFPLIGASGIISTFYGLYLQAGSTSGATVTTAYGQSTEIPAFGSTKYTAYFQATAGTSGVCIGGLSTTYQLYVATDSAGKPGVGGLWTVVSDERVKKNIVDCDDALAKLSQLRVREFEYDDAVCDHINVCKGSKHYGFLAHEYEEVFPEDVKCGNEKFGELEIEDCKAINTGQTSALVIRAIQQLSDKVNLLEAKLGL